MKTTANGLDLSVIIPAYNESARLPPTLDSYLAYLNRRGKPYEVIVVDDGSVDRTAELVAEREKATPTLRTLRLAKNQGKGAALKAGVAAAQGALVLIADADGATPITEIARLEAALSDSVSIAFASRALPSHDTKVEARIDRKLLGRAFNMVINIFLLPGCADTQCGFKLFTAPAAKFLFGRLTIPGYGFDLEILYMARRARIKAVEVPVNWHHVPGSKVSLIIDAAVMFRDILRIRVRHRSLNQSVWDEFKISDSH